MNRFERHVFERLPVASEEMSQFFSLIQFTRNWFRESDEVAPVICQLYRGLTIDPAWSEKHPWAGDFITFRRWHDERAAALWCWFYPRHRGSRGSHTGVDEFLWPESVGKFFDGRAKRGGFADFQSQRKETESDVMSRGQAEADDDDSCSLCGRLLLFRFGQDMCPSCDEQEDEESDLYASSDDESED